MLLHPNRAELQHGMKELARFPAPHRLHLCQHIEQLRLEVLVWVGLWEGVREVAQLRDHFSRDGREEVVELLLLIIYVA